ncbi:7275_t:CDS:2 [Funneliformis mosseae]|uniref:7275_t:CDS:1 n=1 Tax=Funneliformis mosseae TaxID=27381 RepID=A0A9N9B2D7_FUNMO|nr:7275_t:CDS:2 [Funneliformis mosseae]
MNNIRNSAKESSLQFKKDFDQENNILNFYFAEEYTVYKR